MNDLTRVFIVEQDEPALIMLHLYLDQFDDIEIVGSAIARTELEQQISRVKPDVVIYNLPTASETLPSLISNLKSRSSCPALVCIREGNFLPLEGTFKQTPEALLPSFTTVSNLLDAIRRSAAKYKGTVNAPAQLPLPKAG
jgi:DNA-binding NarL/FixJ family response regulator